MKKYLLYLVAAFIAVMLWNDWQMQHAKKHGVVNSGAVATKTAEQNSASTSSSVPATFNTAAEPVNSAPETPAVNHVKTRLQKQTGKTIEVNTDLLHVNIALHGGNIISAALPKYTVSVTDDSPVYLLNPESHKYYVVENGWTNIPNANKLEYRAAKSSYQLKPGQKELQVVLQAKSTKGLLITKTYTFKSDHYAVDVATSVKNESSKTWQGSYYNQIIRLASEKHHLFSSRGYYGASISTSDKPYDKQTFKDLQEQNLGLNNKGGWVAMQNHYFLSTWIAPSQQEIHYYSTVQDGNFGDDKLYTVGFVMPSVTLKPGKTANSATKLYVGPEIASRLEKLDKGLKLTIDYGFLSPISQFIFWLMAWVEKIVGNWGWSIVIVTILIKLVFYKFSHKSLVSMAKMRDLAPKMKTLRERHKGDKQAMSKATMELYKKEKVNPAGGCLPMLIQIPVFIALYYVLFESVQLRQAPWIFWIHDLSAKDPYYILPILMGISMFIQQKLTPTADPQQAKMMMILPVVFTFFFASFPAGLVLYWLVNNLVQSLHQWWAIKLFEKEKARKKLNR